MERGMNRFSMCGLQLEGWHSQELVEDGHVQRAHDLRPALPNHHAEKKGGAGSERDPGWLRLCVEGEKQASVSPLCVWRARGTARVCVCPAPVVLRTVGRCSPVMCMGLASSDTVGT